VAKVVLAPCVEEELWEIWSFISLDNPDAATRVVEAAYETFVKLAETPGLGKPRKFNNPQLKDVRSWRISGFDNYLIFTAPYRRGSKRFTFIMAHGTLTSCSGKSDIVCKSLPQIPVNPLTLAKLFLSSFVQRLCDADLWPLPR
jgi:plasmid stabilization system protein ParE